MKKWLFITIGIILISLTWISCSGSKGETETSTPDENKPLNITILLDLSDRLKKNDSPSQFERDTAIVNHTIDLFIKQCVHDKIKKSKNCFRIMFYPHPQIASLASLSEDLVVNLDNISSQADKKSLLLSMKSKINNSLTEIYDNTIQTSTWPGSDIWGFFSSKDVDKYCIKEGYRNIIIILTDGYLYFKDNMVDQSPNYSYITKRTLSKADSGLIVKRDGLEDIEVLMLELNPSDVKQYDRMEQILTDWFNGMGVQKVEINKTALPTNTKTLIDKFLGISPNK